MALVGNVSEPCVCILHIRALGQGTRYSNVNDTFLPQPTLLTKASVTHRLVIPLLNTAFRQSVLSQILFSITSGFVAPYYNQQYTFSCTVATSTGTCTITLYHTQNHCFMGNFKSPIKNHNSNINTSKVALEIQYNSL